MKYERQKKYFRKHLRGRGSYGYLMYFPLQAIKLDVLEIHEINANCSREIHMHT